MLHGAWDAFATPTTEAPLAMLAAVVLLAVCVQTLALEERLDAKDRPAMLGQSIAMERKIPSFPTGRSGGSAAVAAQPISAATGYACTLVIEGNADSPGRRVPLQRAGGPVELAPGLACEVRAHPTDPDRLGLKNLTPAPWKLTMSDGRCVDVPPDKNAVLADGAVIDFGSLRARVEMA